MKQVSAAAVGAASVLILLGAGWLGDELRAAKVSTPSLAGSDGSPVIDLTAGGPVVKPGMTLDAEGTGNIDLPNNGSARFKVEGVAVSANVTASNLNTLTGGGGTALHSHSELVISGLTTTALSAGLAGYFSSANTLGMTDSANAASSRFVGIFTGEAGSVQVAGTVEAAFTTDGGACTPGARVYLAAAADDTGEGAGKLTATPPVAGQLAPVGICLDASAYAGSKTAKVLLQVLEPEAL